jgi:hypothetical protein
VGAVRPRHGRPDHRPDFRPLAVGGCGSWHKGRNLLPLLR